MNDMENALIYDLGVVITAINRFLMPNYQEEAKKLALFANQKELMTLVKYAHDGNDSMFILMLDSLKTNLVKHGLIEPTRFPSFGENL